jgi:phage/plasmid-associated DNA primase
LFRRSQGFAALPPLAVHWDTDPLLIGCPNGLVDLRTLELRPGHREDRIIMRMAVPFDRGADCTRRKSL